MLTERIPFNESIVYPPSTNSKTLNLEITESSPKAHRKLNESSPKAHRKLTPPANPTLFNFWLSKSVFLLQALQLTLQLTLQSLFLSGLAACQRLIWFLLLKLHLWSFALCTSERISHCGQNDVCFCRNHDVFMAMHSLRREFLAFEFG